MTELRFEGKVNLYVKPNDKSMATTITIGDRDVITEIEKQWPFKRDGYVMEYKLSVTLGVEPDGGKLGAVGELEMYYGFTGTEVTPPELPAIYIGGKDLVDSLEDLHEREVILIVEDA